MASPDDRKYSESHEWHKLDGDLVVIGISKHAVDELTDITYVEFTQSEGPISKGDAFGEIESVKTTSELYAGIDGEIVATNDAVVDNPALVNEDPWDKAWLIKLKPADTSQLDDLMSAEAYDKQHA